MKHFFPLQLSIKMRILYSINAKNAFELSIQITEYLHIKGKIKSKMHFAVQIHLVIWRDKNIQMMNMNKIE